MQCFVILVTMFRELYDDFKRFLRDMEVNSQRYYKLTPKGVWLGVWLRVWLSACWVTFGLFLRR